MTRMMAAAAALALGLPRLALAQADTASFVARDVRFASGESLPEVRIYYRTLGRPRTGPGGVTRNAVLILHGTGGSGQGFLGPNYAGQLFQPGQPLDTSRYYIIIPDNVGHGRSSKPSDGLHGRFPHYAYADMVGLQYRLLTEGLHVNHLYLVMGTSMGCMHTWLWLERWPDFMDGGVPLACAPTQIAGRNRMWRKLTVDAIRNSPDYNNGDYTAQPSGLLPAMYFLWMVGSAPLNDQRLGPTRDSADAYITSWMRQRLATFDANDFAYAVDASRDYDPSADLARIQAPVLAINSADDEINPPELGLMERLIPQVHNARYVLIPISPATRGHGTHSLPAVWKNYLVEFQDSLSPHESSNSAPDLVTIESLASGGAGVTHLEDGMIAFVPRTAPGDRVRLRDVRRKRRHAEARVAEVVEAAPGRVSPPCPHFTADRCGSCQWQHLSAETQLAAKARIVGDALRRIGKLDVADPEVVRSPRELAYRTTMTLTVRRRGAHAVVGYHDAFDPDRVFMLGRCHIARDELNALWQAVKPVADALPTGDDVRLKLRLASDGSRHVMVDGGEGAWTGYSRVADALKAAGEAATTWWTPAGGAPRRMAGAAADPSSVSFAQVNAEVAELLKAAVLEACGRAGVQARVLDLYAGAGDTALPLAAAGHDVVMVETDTRAVRRAEELAKQQGIALRCIAGRVEDHLEKLLPADVVIVNPPRAGLSEEVTARLHASTPARLVYVSCDPATLARDLSRLTTHDARLTSLVSYDMFPQTDHVETLAVLERQQS